MKRKTDEQLAYEQWYVENTFDLERSPLGSRDCYLQRRAWEAALAYAQCKKDDRDFDSSEVQRAARQRAIDAALADRPSIIARMVGSLNPMITTIRGR